MFQLLTSLESISGYIFLAWHGRGRRFDPDQVHQSFSKQRIHRKKTKISSALLGDFKRTGRNTGIFVAEDLKARNSAQKSKISLGGREITGSSPDLHKL
jgi:hypothetical protein